ncbi:hypothetical protein E4P40_08430 [Blastococcus sp. CT_GayMR20]|uniref:AMP-binding enzyme n=1 Tax=Blastococcus sp. CT_GayMR20 TaxID=2559609 RepID=UPI00107355F7|nr:hypothetical protein [Blastococcus sp. CT_GayMR20]TFV89380.1 hypothetical protein E4P40_08430 [Blastococcus sp. CT_GayMR20]
MLVQHLLDLARVDVEPAADHQVLLAVDDVEEAVVVPFFIALKNGTSATPDEVVAFCKERLAAYKYPREVVVLDELPKGGSGKVLKTELRASL